MMTERITYQDIKNARGDVIERRPLREGKITGVVEYYDPKTKKVRQRATFLENQLHGPMLTYDKNEVAERKFEFLQGKLHGVSEFYRNGNLYALIPFIEGKINGVAAYYDAGGNKRMEASYKEGVLEGDMVLYGSLGHVSKVIPHKGGKKQGIAKSYYPGGALLKTEPYLNNLLEGNVTQYYENGKVCAWYFYECGKMMEGPRIFDQNSKELLPKN